MILLDTGAIRAFWNSHLTVARLVDDANRTSGQPLIVPTRCLLEAEQQIPGAGVTFWYMIVPRDERVYILRVQSL